MGPKLEQIRFLNVFERSPFMLIKDEFIYLKIQ